MNNVVARAMERLLLRANSYQTNMESQQSRLDLWIAD